MECLMADEITERECELGVFGELKRGKIGHRPGSKDRLTSDCHRSRDRLQIRCRQNRLASFFKVAPIAWLLVFFSPAGIDYSYAASASRAGTAVTASGGRLIDKNGDIWSIRTGRGILKNGAVVGAGIKLQIDGTGVIWALTEFNGWYKWTDSEWAPQSHGPKIKRSSPFAPLHASL
jgi:hypothetical protein